MLTVVCAAQEMSFENMYIKHKEQFKMSEQSLMVRSFLILIISTSLMTDISYRGLEYTDVDMQLLYFFFLDRVELDQSLVNSVPHWYTCVNQKNFDLYFLVNMIIHLSCHSL